MRSLRGANAVDGAATAHPDRSGMGDLLPDGGVQRGVRRAGQLPVEAHLQVGQAQPPEEVEALDCRTGTSAGSTSPGKTAGSSATATAAPTWSSMPGPQIVRHQMVKGSVVADDPALAEYWAGRRRRAAPPPLDDLSLRLLQAQRGRCPAVRGASPRTPTTRRRAPASGSSGCASPARRSPNESIYQERGTSDDSAHSVSYTPDVADASTPTATAGQTCNAREPLGLLEPDARQRACPVLRGPRRSNAPGLPGELVGEFANEGAEYQPDRRARRGSRPMTSLTNSSAAPSPTASTTSANDEGWVSVGDSADTASFAVEAIRRWWCSMGARTLSSMLQRLLITADAGGSNGYRVRLWKLELAGVGQGDRARHHRLPLPAGNLQVEQDRAPACSASSP